MQDYQRRFIEFALHHQALKFGEFTLKSGRVAPYFFNAGVFHTGEALLQLGEFYADALIASGVSYEQLFGPAYKGIPLVSALAIALAKRGDDRPFSFNRKEIKDHGEGGNIVGAPLKGNILVVDDVITSGLAFRESAELILKAKATIAGLLLALDREEKGRGDLSAIDELKQTFQIPVITIITLADLMQYLQAHDALKQHLPAIEHYRSRYAAH